MSQAAQYTVVLRYRDGHTVRCQLQGEFQPWDEEVIEAVDAGGEPLRAPLSELKAVFFVKDPRQREAEMALGRPAEIPEGSVPARVEFFDGEIVRGRVQNYSLANRGFFLYPTGVEGNNARIFVVASALNTLEFEG